MLSVGVVMAVDGEQWWQWLGFGLALLAEAVVFLSLCSRFVTEGNENGL